MITNYNKHGPIYPPENEVCKIRGAPGLHVCDPPPDIGLVNKHPCASKPPGSVLKFLYRPRNGIAIFPPAESQPGGAAYPYYAHYDSLTRGSPVNTALTTARILPACSIHDHDRRSVPSGEMQTTIN